MMLQLRIVQMFRHEMKASETRMSSLETSTDQVSKPVYKQALHSWKTNIPEVSKNIKFYNYKHLYCQKLKNSSLLK